ncbi:Phospho-2-dehydro-3-deoxyheptonate aldolase [Fulvia fulva]|uniref:Phospho-2-dehydro-3-deoxyheptonate aldolase n=1 Tax=Passalora fulva TaxID=5499 RepID=A0A9Q8L7G3_PASFU|nr:Phospho-2-dehydro-3-deoxyheptonate aldolase [Fulvia fulva]KAK4634648.1 Phospho-2-dehydro-3-deoxyheptonate aldolase [Fulvia fulva]KAK4637566.1 Phospho-2-dehydro-3-deoxyheptonate aldolase [Fulvia fulva]UJO12290.1 Phospho-2-dehydro-3-deoxyheptonate aldolase [Fulvia fulva]WPV10232.1 Phospho-2-dehydro-3-deoxyheptonate aldolase [Fulvia fulva]WPV24229.1 Phospho-2-dehydro-3-deoxyheptonate aldolase [Fulvia fulva]
MSTNARPPREAQHADWTPSSWRDKPIAQKVDYEDTEAVDTAIAKLKHVPPLVTSHEIWRLRTSLKNVALGKAFLLQGGDCAELFDYCNDAAIDSKIRLLLQMSLVLIWGGNKPLVRIARMAGQYAKPRSKPTEIIDGKEVPSYRGDILNGHQLDSREIDPDRLVQAYFHSAATLNYVRAQLSSGFADLHNPMDWGLGHVQDPALLQKYSGIVESISSSLRFMKTVGADTSSQLQSVDLFTSHEALLLAYEEGLTRKLKHPSNRETSSPPHQASETSNKTSGATMTDDSAYYNTSAHFIWIGDRTRQPDHAHIEYARGVENPIGIKVGPTTVEADLAQLLDLVNPRKEIGKVTLITRYGKDKIAAMLPKHIEAVRKTGHIVVWQCDPMHGNTRSTEDGIKTRSFDDVFDELSSALRIHNEVDSYLGGVHLELTGDAVTECTGGSEGLRDNDLSQAYHTYCDPRLNEKQALELAFLVADSQREMGSPRLQGADGA